MDELFLLPDSASPIAVPRAYWLAQPSLASHIMLLTPSSQTFSRITAAVESKAGHGYYDMEIINSLFSSSCSVLPHRTYSLLTGEFRRARNKHQCFLSKRGDGLGKPEWEEGWDPDRAGKLSGEPAWVHFSDYPLGKPWEREGSKGLWGKMMPGCWNEKGREVKWKEGEERDEEKEGLDCRERELWRGWYEDFWGRREVSSLFPWPSNVGRENDADENREYVVRNDDFDVRGRISVYYVHCVCSFVGCSYGKRIHMNL